jgi:hypothetical protein
MQARVHSPTGMDVPAAPPTASGAGEPARIDVERLLRLWTRPLPAGDDAEAAFREFYNDPVSINGEPSGTDDLVARARALQAALEWPDLRVLDAVQCGQKLTVAFRLRGRQVGTLSTAAGPLLPTRRVIQLRTVSVMTLLHGRIREMWTVTNELGALSAMDAVALLPDGPAGDDVDPWTIGGFDDHHH